MSVNNLDIVSSNWLQFFNSSNLWLKDFANIYVKHLKESEISSNLSAICGNRLLRMFENLTQEAWAAKSMKNYNVYNYPSTMYNLAYSNISIFNI